MPNFKHQTEFVAPASDLLGYEGAFQVKITLQDCTSQVITATSGELVVKLKANEGMKTVLTEAQIQGFFSLQNQNDCNIIPYYDVIDEADSSSLDTDFKSKLDLDARSNIVSGYKDVKFNTNVFVPDPNASGPQLLTFKFKIKAWH